MWTAISVAGWLGAGLFLSVADWSDGVRSWQGDAVGFVFYLLGSAASFAGLIGGFQAFAHFTVLRRVRADPSLVDPY